MASAKSLVHLTVTEFLALTASSVPTPGGGSSAALTAALAAALVEKIAAKTMTRHSKARRIHAKTRQLRRRLTRAIHEDARSYWRVVLAFRKQDRRAALRALVQATMVPKQVIEDAREVCRVIKMLRPLSSRVWRSDLQCAWLLAEASQGAGLALVIANQQFMEQWSKRR